MSGSTHLSQRIQPLADLCLSHLAEDPEELLRFMEQTGYDPSGLRQAVGSDHLARGLIDYFAANESLLLTVCANGATTPEAFMRVWHQLNRAD